MNQADHSNLATPEYYVARAGDNRLINELVRRLRTGPEEIALAYTLRCFEGYPGFALRLASRCLHSRQSLERMLVECIRSGQPGIISPCLDMLRARIGERRVINILIQEARSHTAQVVLARYYLGMSRDPELREKIGALDAILVAARAQRHTVDQSSL